MTNVKTQGNPIDDNLKSSVESADRRFDFLGIGECMVEFYSDLPLSHTEHLTRAFGGDVLNSLIGIARLGGQCGFISQVGDDPFGARLQQQWESEGINFEFAPIVAGENGMYFISVAADGEREFSYRRHATAASQIKASDLNEGYLRQTRWLLLSGITQALSKDAQATTLAAARIAKKFDVKVAYDPNYRPRLWERRGGVDAAKAAFEELTPYVDWLLPSDPADSVLLGKLPDSGGDSAFYVAQGFANYCANVALKCGADGCIVSTNNGLQIIPGVKARKVLDTTGAGDLWNGSFLYQLMSGKTTTEAANIAHRLASEKLAYRGAIPPREMYQSFKKNGFLLA